MSQSADLPKPDTPTRTDVLDHLPVSQLWHAVWSAILVFGIAGISSVLATPRLWRLISDGLESFGENWGVFVNFVLIVAGAFFAGHYALCLVAPVRWHCPNPSCNRTLNSSIHWRCGFCKRGVFFFPLFWRCGHFNCLARTKAYQCEHCGALTYVTKERDGRNPASQYYVKEKTEPSEAEVRGTRARELEDKEHQRQAAEADRKLLEVSKGRLQAELELAILRRRQNEPEPRVMSKRDQLVAALAEEFELARTKCTTLEQTIVEEREMKARFRTRDDDHELKELMDNAIENMFESMRLKFGLQSVRVK